MTLTSTASPHAHPVTVALARLAPTSRRTMLSTLGVVAKLLTSGQADAYTCPWTSLRYPHLMALRQALLDLHHAPSTVNRTLSTVRAVLREAWRLGQYDGSLLLQIRDVPAVRGRRLLRGRMLTTQELTALLRSCRRDPNRTLGARDQALLALLYGAGLRRAEAATVQLADLRRDGLRVLGKGGREDLQPLPRRELLRPWLALRGGRPGPLLYPVDRRGGIHARPLHYNTLSTALAARARAAGVRLHFSPHDLRRSYISQLLASGVELRKVQLLARHSQVTTTQRYDRRPMADLAAAADRLPL